MTKLPTDRAEAVRRDPPHMMNVAEAAAYIGISPRKLRDEATKSRVRFAKIGDRIIFPLIAVNDYIAALAAVSV